LQRLIFERPLFGCPPAMDARGRRPVRLALCTPLGGGASQQKFEKRVLTIFLFYLNKRYLRLPS